MAWASVGAAVGAAAGAAISAGLQSREASKTRKWARQMRATAYQATMKDMRLAGLNPILASRTGPSAAPQGAMAQIPDFGRSLAAGAQAGVSASKVKVEKELMNSQSEQASAGASQASSQATLNMTQVDESKAKAAQANTQAAANVVSAREAAARATILESEIPGKKLEQGMDESWFGKGTRYIRRGSAAIQGLDARRTKRGR